MMIDGTCTLENVPDISDVHVMVKICESLGAKIDTSLSPDGSVTLQIDPRGINTYEATSPGVSKIRASYYLLGALLGRCGKASLRMPGGCDFGMGARGADYRNLNGGIISLHAEPLRGAKIFLDIVSVGATINVMLAAAKAQGKTTIVNAAKEPHIVDVAN